MRELTEEEIKTEEKATDEPTKTAEAQENQGLSHNPVSFIYGNLSILGMQTIRYSKRIFKFFGRRAVKPLKFIWVWIRLLLVAIDHFGLKSIHAFTEEARYLQSEVKMSLKYLRKAARDSSGSIIYILAHYVKKALIRHKQFFKSMANAALPLMMVVVFLITLGYWNGVTYALEVIYNGETIGYIEDENVYLESRNLTIDKLSVGPDVNNGEKMLENPQYSLALVSVNKLVDVATLSDNLINASDKNITNACGVYIDGEFVCSVKNENDARSVFNSILEEVGTTDESEKVGFVEEISYVQGLYPDDDSTMWDAAKLAETLKSTKQGEVLYTAQRGDSFSKIATDNDITIDKLKAMNPNIGDSIYPGDQLVVSQEVKYVRVKVTKTVTKNEDVDYETETTYNSSLFRGDSRVIRSGQKGIDSVTYQITTINGILYSTDEIERIRTIDPVNEKIERGTKSTSVSSSYGSYNLTVSSRGFVWPSPSARTISQYYGYGHKGLDITSSGASGKVIVAAASGTVEIAGSTGDSYGQQVVINHGNGLRTRYAHCLSGSISVSVGQRVSAGQSIARIGSTGNSTGPHLHFEVISNGSTVNPLNYVSR